MEMAYIQAENLKHKRTFTKTLIVLAPFVTALMNFFAPLWFQLNSYNWWYILLYPGFLTLTCALIEQRDNGKLKYRAVASLPVSQNKVWKAKIGVAGIYSCVGNFIFLALNLLGGFAILVINEIPLTIGIWQAAARLSIPNRKGKPSKSAAVLRNTAHRICFHGCLLKESTC